MKLLIVTQVVDLDHPVLGFFHRWIEEFAAHCESVEVVCLQEGRHDLPAHVTVHSLGKEAGAGRLTYVYRLYRYCWQLRGRYDNVFVHMNQVYVLLAGLLWRMLRKRVGLWYAHGTVSASLRAAVVLSHVIFTSTAQGMRVPTKKRVITGQGIDPAQFTYSERTLTQPLRLCTIGRVGASKHIDTLLRAVALLQEQGVACHFTVVGGPATAQEEQYQADMHTLVNELEVADSVTWAGPQPYRALPALLAQTDVFIHDGATNSLDKTLVEAVMSGCVVISSNPSYRGLTEALAPELLFPPQNHAALAACVSKQLVTPSQHVTAVREHVLETCSIAGLITTILREYEPSTS